MQIVRMQDGERVVLWSTTSTWGTEEDLGDWQPAPIASMPFAPSPSATVISPPQESPPEESIFIPDWEDEGATPKPWFSAATSTRYSMRSGPLVGHTTDRTVRLWALQGQNQVMELAYRQVGASVGHSLAMPPNADQGAAVLEVTDLQPNAQYEYQVRIQGETVGEGVWKTASPSNLPTSFKFLLASCMDVKSNRHPLQPVWDRVLEQGMPDFAILNGDTVYLNDDDWTSTNEIILERVWYRNLAQRDESHFRNFISKVPTYSKNLSSFTKQYIGPMISSLTQMPFLFLETKRRGMTMNTALTIPTKINQESTIPCVRSTICGPILMQGPPRWKEYSIPSTEGMSISSCATTDGTATRRLAVNLARNK